MVICTMPGCQTTAGCLCGMAGIRPRWIADDPEKILYERMPDGSYRPVYKMVQITNEQSAPRVNTGFGSCAAEDFGKGWPTTEQNAVKEQNEISR